MMVGAELADELEHVAPETALVGRRVAGLVDAAIDAAAEMLDEGAEQARIGGPDREVAIQQDAGLSACGVLSVRAAAGLGVRSQYSKPARAQARSGDSTASLSWRE